MQRKDRAPTKQDTARQVYCLATGVVTVTLVEAPSLTANLRELSKPNHETVVQRTEISTRNMSRTSTQPFGFHLLPTSPPASSFSCILSFGWCVTVTLTRKTWRCAVRNFLFSGVLQPLSHARNIMFCRSELSKGRALLIGFTHWWL